jgi:hypothetical protein
VVEDCCADGPEAHARTLEQYGQFLFERVTGDALRERHAARRAALARLDAPERARAPA